MKYITFTIPCYNSENYMRRCVDSLLVGGEDVEILIIDDGSSDRTGAIADEYEMLYPNIVKAVHKPNGGHGSGVNRGLELAHGLYYKVVDSDDWFDRDAYLKMLDKIKSFEVAQFPDLIICNYVYDHLDEGIQKPMNYRNVFPTEKMCNWNTIGHFHPSQYLIMHALMFQTKVLRQSGVKLPEHTFYVDNLFSYQPLPYAKNLYYMDIDLYHYYLGREDQSVNEKVLMKRIDQQIRVTELIANKNFFGVEEFVDSLSMNDKLRKLFGLLDNFDLQDEQLMEALKLAKGYDEILSSIDTLLKLREYLKAYGIEKYISYELGLISDYTYYTGIIFQGYTYGTGEPIVKGGRYDKLLSHFGKDAAAIGFAIVVDQLMAALSRQDIDVPVIENSSLIVFEEAAYHAAIKRSMELRRDGVNTQMVLKDKNKTKEDYASYAVDNRINRVEFIEE